ncbi:MAG: HAD family hydrolase [Lachnospiraceae bacterium]|jgi:phosphoglycolate phosphatase|nr:HAD family hydrolase [Lachnospiraceae bacterium]
MERIYDTVIFDLDGTLMDTLEDLANAVNEILKRHGYPVKTITEVRRIVGNGLRQTLTLCLPEGTEQQEVERLLPEFAAYYQAHCQIKTKPYDGIMDTLRELCERGYKMAIVSNKRDEAVKTLNEEYFQAYVKVAIGENEDMGIKKKPAPDTVFQALRELGSVRERAVYVGDSEVDRMTAENAGLPCVSVDWGFRDREELEKLAPAYLISRPEELLEILC